MSYTAATVSDLITRYPAFASVAEATVQYWLDEAVIEVALYPEATRARAEMAYAAHMMASNGTITGAIPAGVTSFKSGTFSATVADGIASMTGINSTAYGRELAAMRRAQFAGPRLAWTPPAADYAG